jgi:ribonucleoside-diphosphate reductase alpha chain
MKEKYLPSEQTLSYYNNCLLGSFVLPKYIKETTFDYDIFKDDIRLATRLMNHFSDLNEDKHPLEKQRQADKFGKRIGIEFTGLGDVFAFMGYEYGDEFSVEFSKNLSDMLLDYSMTESLEIAKEQGTCEALATREQRQNFVDTCDWNLSIGYKEAILEHGLANCALLTVGPTGTLSIISGNCTSGIEPLFKFSYKRKNRIDGKEYSFIHLPAAEYMLENLDEFKGLTLEQAKTKMNYVEADEIHWKDRIKVQSSLQKNIDASISSTINLPNNCTKETIQNIYKYAWKMKLKGVTVFRDGCKDGVLSSIDNEDSVQQDALPELFKKDLLDEETSVRHRVSWKGSKLYVNVSLDEDANPIEIFAKLPKEAGFDDDGIFNPGLYYEKNSLWDSLNRMISMSLRYSVPLEDIIKQLDKSTYSMVDAAAILKRILSKYLVSKTDEFENETNNNFQICPGCGEKTYILEGGCGHCSECSYSKCG